MCFKLRLCRFAAVPGNDGDLQDEEGAAGGGGIRPGAHLGPHLLPGRGDEDVRAADGGRARRHRLPGDQTVAQSRTAAVGQTLGLFTE